MQTDSLGARSTWDTLRRKAPVEYLTFQNRGYSECHGPVCDIFGTGPERGNSTPPQGLRTPLVFHRHPVLKAPVFPGSCIAPGRLQS